MKAQLIRVRLFILAALVAGSLLAARPAAAQACQNDIDCPGTECGTQVCNWNLGITCKPAGTDRQGGDGWCATTEDCKCRGMGAVCNVPYCSFTVPPGGSTGGASGARGGASGSTGGSTGTGGAASGTGGAASGSDAGTKPASGGGGGCAVAGVMSAGGLSLMAGLALALLALRRRRASC